MRYVAQITGNLHKRKMEKNATASKFKVIKKIIWIIALTYLLILLLAYFVQERLIFPPAYNSFWGDGYIDTDTDQVEPIKITMSDGCTLSGYWINATQAKSANILFYFGANAEDISYLVKDMAKLTDWSVVLMHYRGYADSQGEPSTEMLYRDAQEIYDYVLGESEVEYKNTVIMGRSIGSSVATYLASTRANSSVILISPFDSMKHVVSSKCPIFPIGWMLKHKFPSIEYAPNVTTPVYMLVGSEDWLVPTSLSMKLASSFAGEVKLTQIEGANHNTIDNSKEYWPLIRSFLDEQN